MSFAKRIRAAAAAFKTPSIVEPLIAATDTPSKQATSDVDPMMCGLSDAIAAGWYDRALNELAPGFGIDENDTLIDIGCGEGGSARFYLQRCNEALLLDMVFENVVTATTQSLSGQPAKPLGVCGSVNSLPVRDAYANKIIMTEVLEHTDNPQQALLELFRIASPGAKLLLTVPSSISEHTQKDWAPAQYFEKPNHIHCFDEQTLKSLCEEAGFTVQHQLRWGFYWSVALLLHWVSQRELGIQLDGAALDSIKPPYSDLMLEWAHFWRNVLLSPEHRPLALTLNQAFPRNIGVVAQKPS